MNADQRFAAKVSYADSGCWEWTAALQSQGYGSFADQGAIHLAHRWSYERHVGPIPDGLQIDHLCRNRTCVNPAHLEPVTQAENRRRGLYGVLATHCRRGHAMTADNTYAHPRGQRVCLTCRRAHSRAYRQRKAA